MNNNPALNRNPISQFSQLYQQPARQPATTVKKKKMLVWSDCAAVTTGFGVVSKYIMAALHATGKYEIDQLAINQPAGFLDKNEFPYNMIPARLGDKTDPFGNQMLVDSIRRKDYDILFIINDTYVTHGVASSLNTLQRMKREQNQTVFNIVYYYPIDCRFMPSVGDMVKLADVAVAYTKFGAEATKKHLPNKPNAIIYHGTDTKTFHKINPEERKMVRNQCLNVHSDDTFVLVSVNRNSIRKDIGRTILAFAEFRKQVPDSVLYVHAKLEDGTSNYMLNLGIPAEELAMSLSKDVIFPKNYSSGKGFSAKILNQLYNMGDAFITTNLGEGWGLTITEAMSTGLPVIAPRHTSIPEILGDNRGYSYPCREQVFIDNSGFRPLARMDDIVEEMMACYNNWKNKTARHKTVIQKAHEFTRQYSWDNVCKQWVSLFNQLKNKPTGTTATIQGELV